LRTHRECFPRSGLKDLANALSGPRATLHIPLGTNLCDTDMPWRTEPSSESIGGRSTIRDSPLLSVPAVVPIFASHQWSSGHLVDPSCTQRVSRVSHGRNAEPRRSTTKGISTSSWVIGLRSSSHLLLHIIERIWGVDSEADENHVRVGIGQRSEATGNIAFRISDRSVHRRFGTYS